MAPRKKYVDSSKLTDEDFDSLGEKYTKKWYKRCVREGDCLIMKVERRKGTENSDDTDDRPHVAMRLKHRRRKPVTNITAARAFFMFSKGIKYIAKEISHRCHNKQCVEISHLVAETPLENQSREKCASAGKCLPEAMHSPPCLF